MITLIDNKTETIKLRIINGNELCNELWQTAKTLADHPEEYNAAMDKISGYTEKLRELVQVIKLNGYTDCVFDSCKWDDKFFCFGCTKKNPEEK